MSELKQFYGWVEDQKQTEAALQNAKHPYMRDSHVRLCQEVGNKREDTDLWPVLLQTMPNWRRGAQGIGDCVSWGAELAATVLKAKQFIRAGRSGVMTPMATEPIYGGSRVEARKLKVGDWEDGSTGSSACKFMKEWGCLSRDDYSSQTNNPEHDLRVYSAKKAKDWGYYGCGGQKDNGTLDNVAKEFPIKNFSLCRNFDEVATAIAVTKSPVIIGSWYGTDMKRNKYGECAWNTRWAHLMVFLAVRFGDRPGCRLFQSWGPGQASGPDDEGVPNVISETSWWVPAADVDKMMKSMVDGYAIGEFEDWKVDAYDYSSNFGLREG